MGLFDSIKREISGSLKREVQKEVRQGISNAGNRTESFTFSHVPATLEELRMLPEASLQSPFATAALTLLALMKYEDAPEECFRMLDFLNGPNELTPYQKQFLQERLRGRQYTVASFFEGAVPENGYQPSVPLKISVFSNAYSYPEENWAILWLTSGGADSPREIKLRKKPSTGEWFQSSEYGFLAQIRLPKEADPWA